MNSQKVVTPVDPGSSPGGVQMLCNYLKRLDSGLAVIPDSTPGRNDG